MASSSAGPSSPRKLAGTVPGILDPSQRDRLLRFSQSSLFFASFNPRAATSSDLAPGARKLSLNEERYNPKRVVVETSPTGESSWRFVPKAQIDDGAVDEGDWPRVIDICGTLYECSQDQWDIYKLDPLYECRVRAAPALTTITPTIPKPPEIPLTNGKRNTSWSSGIPPLNPRKKLNTGSSSRNFSNDDYSEVEEVEDMVIDQSMPPPRAKSAGLAGQKLRKKREEILRGRQQRRENISRRAEKLSTREEGENYFDFSANNSPQRSQSVPTDNTGKRKATSVLADPLRSPDLDYAPQTEEELLRHTASYEQTAHGKRTRTTSPASARRELEAKRVQREQRRQDRQQTKFHGRRQQWHEEFMQQVYAEVPDLGAAPTDPSNHKPMDEMDEDDEDDDAEDDSFTGGPSTDTSFDEDTMRNAAIAESRRKLAELEADRPIWEAEAKKRALRERAEQEAERLKAEERKWAEAKRAEAARQADARRRAQEAQEQQKAEQREREEAARRQREKQQRQQHWNYGPWTTQRALERYKALSEAFDTTKFSANDPLTFENVPWPVLTHPSNLSVEDVDWASVEKFFEKVQHHMRDQDYKKLVEKSHRRFHPDRWRSRNLLKTVVDEAERGCLEVAANTVAQALTPLWRDITGR